MRLPVLRTSRIRLATTVHSAALFALLCVPDISEANRVHSWSFDGNLLDGSASGNDGVLTGGDLVADFVPGRFGDALNVNSAEGVVNTAANNLPLGATDAWTMNVWLNFESTPASLSYAAGFGNHNTFTDTEAGQSRALIEFGAGYYLWGFNFDIDSGTAYIADSEWHMYTVTNDGNNIRMYADGVLVQTAPNALLDSPFTQVSVGNPSIWNSDFRGGVDEFAIWDSAFGQTRIDNLFASNTAIPEPTAAAIALTFILGAAARGRTARR